MNELQVGKIRFKKLLGFLKQVCKYLSDTNSVEIRLERVDTVLNHCPRQVVRDYPTGRDNMRAITPVLSSSPDLDLGKKSSSCTNMTSVLIRQQVAEYEKQHSSCMHCGKKLLHKDKRTIVYRTLFGKLQLRCHRLFHCA